MRDLLKRGVIRYLEQVVWDGKWEFDCRGVHPFISVWVENLISLIGLSTMRKYRLSPFILAWVTSTADAQELPSLSRFVGPTQTCLLV